MVDTTKPFATKPWYASKSIWISVAQGVLGVGIATGVVTPEQAHTALNGVDTALGLLVTLLSGAGIWARATASEKITG